MNDKPTSFCIYFKWEECKSVSLDRVELWFPVTRSWLPFSSVQFSLVAQSCLTLCNPMNHSRLPEFTQTHVHRVGDAIQPSHPLSSPLLLPPVPPSIRVFFNESTLRMRWPKYWSFSFSISPSNEHPGLISFRMDWLDFPAFIQCFYFLRTNGYLSDSWAGNLNELRKLTKYSMTDFVTLQKDFVLSKAQLSFCLSVVHAC